MHGVDQAETFLDPALAHQLLDGIRDIHEAATIGDFEPELFG